MFPYILLILAIFLFSVFAVKKNERGGQQIKIGYSEYVRSNNLAVSAFFIVLLFLLCFRDISIGRDLENYKYLFNSYARKDFAEIFEVSGDTLYVLLNWCIGRITKNYHVLLVVVAIMSVVPIANEYAKDRRKPLLKMVLYINMPIFILLFSGLRQSLAIAAGMIAYKFVKEKRLLPFLLWSVIAVGLHHSAFIVFFLYPLYHMRLKKIHLYFVLMLIAIVTVFHRQIFSILVAFVGALFGGVYDTEISTTSAYSFIILFAMFTVMAYVIPDETKMDEESFGLRNYLTVAALLQCLALAHPLAMRMNYYFIVFIPIAIPKLLLCAKKGYKNFANLAEVVLVVFFLTYYLLTTYRSCVTGESALDIYPYVPFWAE